jgi:hypothetical protein
MASNARRLPTPTEQRGGRRCNAACVEVRLGADAIGVRDSKDRSSAALAFGPAAWTGFLTTLKAAAPGS